MGRVGALNVALPLGLFEWVEDGEYWPCPNEPEGRQQQPPSPSESLVAHQTCLPARALLVTGAENFWRRQSAPLGFLPFVSPAWPTNRSCCLCAFGVQIIRKAKD